MLSNSMQIASDNTTLIENVPLVDSPSTYFLAQRKIIELTLSLIFTGCIKADIPVSPESHLNAHDLSPFEVSKLSFSSCNKRSKYYYPDIWKHLRNIFEPDLFLWLGDNAYSDREDMNYKRKKYNEAREDEYYKTYGPIGLPPISVSGIWDDHNFSSNDLGMEYD